MKAPANKRAVFDLGSNSTRFLLIQGAREEFSAERVVDRGMVVTKLGEGVESESKLKESRMEAVLEVLKEYNRRVNQNKGHWCGGIATSACRRANNCERFFDRVEEITDCRPEIINGVKEAGLTLLGIKKALRGVEEGTVIDVGGGSTELIVFKGKTSEYSRSLRLGVVSLREKYISADRWKQEFETLIRGQIRSVLPVGIDFREPLIVAGGTGTTISAYRQGLNKYQPRLVHGDVIKRNEIKKMVDDFEDVSFEKIKRHPVISSGREDVIVPGLLIIDEFMEALGEKEFMVSDLGILVGLFQTVNC